MASINSDLAPTVDTYVVRVVVLGTSNDWGDLEFTATFQNSEFQITITGCNSEPHLYANVVLTATGDTFLSNGRLCEGGNFQYPHTCIKMDFDYCGTDFKSVCDRWITDFLNNEKNN